MTVPAADNLRQLATAHLYSTRRAMTAAADLLDAIAALHQPTSTYTNVWGTFTRCSCGVTDCPTARLLQGEGE